MLLIQLWDTKSDVDLFLSSLILKKVDSLQKCLNLRNKIFVFILKFLAFF